MIAVNPSAPPVPVRSPEVRAGPVWATSARWVQPEPARRTDPPAPERPAVDPERGVDSAVNGDDDSQLSLELPHDHYDE